jgi:5-oxoprolinase (ATP-hydrolysing)
MNNFTFGDASSGYYETIGGGTGAGATFDGASGVQVEGGGGSGGVRAWMCERVYVCVRSPSIQAHMTNTRITDPETLERRFGVLLRTFALRRGRRVGVL